MASLIQRSFTGGEIAPPLYARSDTAKYSTGLRVMRNHTIMRHGGSANRAGTKWVGEAKNSLRTLRLIEFVFNNDQTYVLEFSGTDTPMEGSIRVIKQGKYVLTDSKAITSIAMGATTTITKAAHGRVNGEEIQIYGSGVPDLERNFIVSNVTTNTFRINHIGGGAVDSSGFAAYVSGGSFGKVYEIASPYTETDLKEVQYIQSADVMTLTHKSYNPTELKRLADDNWTIGSVTFEPSIPAPGGVALSTAAGTNTTYVVTSIKKETYEESYPSTAVGTSVTPDIATPVTITWTADPNAQEYNVYKKTGGGVFGFIGVASSNTFTEKGIAQDTSTTPPILRNPFNANYPATCTYVQQRLAFGNLQNDPEGIYLSKIGQFHNFSTSSPIKDDDAVTFRMAGRQVNEIRHLLDLGNLVIFTASGEWGLQSGAAITPSSIATKQFSYNGANTLSPIVVNNTAIYVQARGSIVRDIGYNYQVDGYTGNDLTIFSAHLFDGFQIVDWAYQKVPHSIVWAVRDDGTVLGLTYVKEHEIIGWHRHDFDGGFVENVCSVPEGDEDAVYFVVKRTVNGVTKRYVERLATRKIDKLIDSAFMDSHLTYDGRNLNPSHTMTLSEGITWSYTNTLRITSSSDLFKASDVGNEIQLTSGDGVIRFRIDSVTSGTVAHGKPHKTVPVGMRNVALSSWTRAVDELVGLWHLEGKNVSVLGDASVVGSPYNPAYEVRTVTNGRVTLDKCYGVAHVGLPITSDIETLDIDSAQGETLIDKKKNISKLTAMVEKSVGFWAGMNPYTDNTLDGLVETKVSDLENYEDTNKLITGTVDVSTFGNWNQNGRIFVRHVDPLPLSVLAIVPTGFVPVQQGGR